MKNTIKILIVIFLISIFSIKEIDGRTIDCAHSDLSKIEVLSCDSVNQSELNKIAKAKNLQYLTINNSNFKTIPKEIINLKKLKYLNLANNNIRTIPNGISNLANLEILILNNNSIEVINPRLYKLSNLEELYLNANSIFYIDKNITSLQHLRKLEVGNNALNSVASLNGMKSLREVDFSNNYIINIGDLGKVTLNRLNINNNLLDIKQVKTRNTSYSINNQNKITIDNKKAFLNIKFLWYNKRNSLINALITTNNNKPVGFKSYDLLHTNSNGHLVDIEDYVKKDGTIIKSGILHSKIIVTAHDSSTRIINQNIKLRLVADNNIKENNNNNNVNDENANTLENSGATNMSLDQSNNESIKDKVIKKIDKIAKSGINKLFGEGTINDEKALGGFFVKLTYYAITILLLIIIFLPLLILLYAIRKVYKSIYESS